MREGEHGFPTLAPSGRCEGGRGGFDGGMVEGFVVGWHSLCEYVLDFSFATNAAAIRDDEVVVEGEEDESPSSFLQKPPSLPVPS